MLGLANDSPTPYTGLQSPGSTISLFQDEPIPDHPGPGRLADLSDTLYCENL